MKIISKEITFKNFSHTSLKIVAWFLKKKEKKGVFVIKIITKIVS